MEKLKSDAEVLYPSAMPPKEAAPAASSVEQSPAVKAYWDAIRRQTRLEQAARPDADVIYPGHRK